MELLSYRKDFESNLIWKTREALSFMNRRQKYSLVYGAVFLFQCVCLKSLSEIITAYIELEMPCIDFVFLHV